MGVSFFAGLPVGAGDFYNEVQKAVAVRLAQHSCARTLFRTCSSRPRVISFLPASQIARSGPTRPSRAITISVWMREPFELRPFDSPRPRSGNKGLQLPAIKTPSRSPARSTSPLRLAAEDTKRLLSEGQMVMKTEARLFSSGGWLSSGGRSSPPVDARGVRWSRSATRQIHRSHPRCRGTSCGRRISPMPDRL